MFVVTKQEMVFEAQTRALNAPRETRVLQAKYVVRNQRDVVEHRNGAKTPKMWVLDLKDCIEIFQVVCIESYYSETFNQMYADTSFRNGLGCVDKMARSIRKHEFWT